ncbi:MAG: hypothetical protein WCO00_17750 [Rhodospirillaceae bacterium]
MNASAPVRSSGNEAPRPGCGSLPANDSLAPASTALLFSAVEALGHGIRLRVTDDNQLWFIVPGGVLPETAGADSRASGLSLTPAERRAILMLRLMFMRDRGLFLSDTGQRFQLRFRPAVVIRRDSAGRTRAKRIDLCDDEEDRKRIDDPGAVLSGLVDVRRSLETVEALLNQPEALTDADPAKRMAARDAITSTGDPGLMSLGQVADAITRGATLPTDEAVAGISAALARTIEAMCRLDDLPPALREVKRQELTVFRRLIEEYLTTVHPREDNYEYRQFTICINSIFLGEQKGLLKSRLVRLEQSLASDFEGIIATMEGCLRGSSSLPLIPHPIIEEKGEAAPCVSLNMIHLMMAVRHHGLSIRLDTRAHTPLDKSLRGWSVGNPPRVHIVEADYLSGR